MIVFRKVNMAKGLVVPIISLVVPVLLVGGCRPAEPESTGPLEVEVVERIEAQPDRLQPQATVSFYDKCAGMLKDFVDAQGMVDYKGLRRKRCELGTVLEEFGKLNRRQYRSWPKADKIAFWIDTYNLQKLKVVVDNYPITPSSRILAGYWGPLNVRHIEGKISRHKFLVMDEQFTFAEVEKRFFRDQFDDPRIFFALTSASLSSPPLRNEPYYGSKLGEQLDDQVKRFLSNPLAFMIDREQQAVYLSAMFELSSWGGEFVEKFATDKKFKDHPPMIRAALNFIANYISESDVSFLEVGIYSVKYMKHDWTINDGS